MWIVTGSDRLPAKCLRTDEFGTPATCTKVDGGTWQVSYEGGPGFGADPSVGPGGGFAALFVLALLAGVGFTVWKVVTARRMARDAGMDTGDATAMTLLSDEGFEATYLASNLRGQGTEAVTTSTRTGAADRLGELQGLLDRGLITQEEHDVARRRILDDL